MAGIKNLDTPQLFTRYRSRFVRNIGRYVYVVGVERDSSTGEVDIELQDVRGTYWELCPLEDLEKRYELASD
jgi:hypothetical protein